MHSFNAGKHSVVDYRKKLEESAEVRQAGGGSWSIVEVAQHHLIIIVSPPQTGKRASFFNGLAIGSSRICAWGLVPVAMGYGGYTVSQGTHNGE